MTELTNVPLLKYWCYKVLPLVYDDSLSYYEILCKSTEKLNEVIENNNNLPTYISELISKGVFLDTLMAQIANTNDKGSKTATADRKTGQLIWLNGCLYRVTRDMLAGDQYTESAIGVTGNIEKITIEEWVNAFVKELNSSIAQEVSERESAVKAVQDSLNTEISDRENAVKAVQDSLNTEISDRENAVKTLERSIENETSYRNALISSDGESTLVHGQNIKFDTNNPLVYGKTEVLNKYFRSLDMLDTEGEAYKLLVQTDDTKDLGKVTRTVINVLDYGADSSGETDSTEAFKSALTACPYHGTIFIPSGTYVISEILNIDKACSIVGGYFGYDIEEPPTDFHSVLIRSTAAGVFKLRQSEIRLENLGIASNNGVAISISFELDDSSYSTKVPRGYVFRNLDITNSQSAVAGSCGIATNDIDMITSLFERVCVFGYSSGFIIGHIVGSNSTSLTFIDCWARTLGGSGVGYQLLNADYCTFIGCACDSSTQLIGYDFETCENVSLLGCGCEGSQTACVRLISCQSMLINMFFVNNSDRDSTYYTILDQGSTNTTLINCVNNNDEGAGFFGSSSPEHAVLGCKYASLSLAGTIYTNNANVISGYEERIKALEAKQ